MALNIVADRQHRTVKELIRVPGLTWADIMETLALYDLQKEINEGANKDAAKALNQLKGAPPGPPQ